MAWTITGDLAAYREAAGALLASDPERHTVLMSVLASLTSVGMDAFGDAPPLLGWWSQDGEVRAAVLQTPPHPLLSTSLPGGSAGSLATALASRGAALPGVNAAEPDAAALAAAWRQATGTPGQVVQRQRLYRLGRLVPPEPPPDGAARIAGAADAEVAHSFFSAFAAEALHEDRPERRLTGRRLAAGQIMLWEVSGEPVALAGITGVLAGTARVGPVYTPPSHRGRGFGGAVTAAVTELAQGRGATSVVLFTDLANPVSNSLYLRLGFRAVEDRVVIRFGGEQVTVH